MAHRPLLALIATGRMRIHHYHKPPHSEDGDLVQIDYGPDYKYYQGDVTRRVPGGGRFTRTARALRHPLQLYRALLTSIRPRRPRRNHQGRRREDGAAMAPSPSPT